MGRSGSREAARAPKEIGRPQPRLSAMTRLLAAPLVLLVVLGVAAPASAQSVYRGKLEVRHSDDFQQGRGKTQWSLVKRGRRLPLRPTATTRARSGDRVVVRGRRAGRWLEGKVRRRPGATVRKASVLGDRSVAVIAFNFASDTRTPWTTLGIEGDIFTDPDSTAAFYREQSYDDIRFDGDVHGWYTLAADPSTCSFADVDAWAAEARTAAGLSLSSYDHFVYLFPYQSSCGWAGLGELPGKESWLNGYTSVRVVAHELGHNMGLHHASSLTCTSGGQTVTKSSTCSADEYGDPFDVMGLSARHSGAWHLNKLGVLGSSNMQVANASGTYTISSALSRRAGPVLLRVPASSSSSYYYDVEIREDGSIFDSWDATSPVVNGVTLHWNPSSSRIEQTMLLDATPGVGGFTDSSLRPGQTFSDGSVSITATAAVNGSATVEVVRAPAPDTQAPTAPGSLFAQVAPGAAALSWSPATDNVGVAGYRVYRDDSLIGTTADTRYDDANVAPGWHKYQVIAYDAAGNARASAIFWALVPAASPPPVDPVAPVAPVDPLDRDEADTSAPVVRIEAPGKGARLRRGRRVTIAASALDDRGTVRMKIKIDGRRRAVADGDTIRRVWSLRRVRRGFHTIVVRAYDASGNAASRSVRVRVVRRRT